MNNYIEPIAEIQEIQRADVISSSYGVTIGGLEGVDNGESKTAIFNAGFWLE